MVTAVVGGTPQHNGPQGDPVDQGVQCQPQRYTHPAELVCPVPVGVIVTMVVVLTFLTAEVVLVEMEYPQ